MQYGMHRHNYKGISTLDSGHTHHYGGATSKNPSVPRHVHLISGETTLNNGHIHRYKLKTGPDIPVNNGHIHYYQAKTSFDRGHIHGIYGYTSKEY